MDAAEGILENVKEKRKKYHPADIPLYYSFFSIHIYRLLISVEEKVSSTGK